MNYKTHLTYILSIDNGNQYYIGSHNGNRTYTEYGILSQSGNPLQKEACKTHDWGRYYERVKLISVEQHNSEEDALLREQELLNQYAEQYPREKILNKYLKSNSPSHYYKYDHNTEWKQKYSQAMKHPKVTTLYRRNKEYSNEEVWSH